MPKAKPMPVRILAAQAIMVRAALPIGSVLVVTDNFEALADEIVTQDSGIFHHTGGNDYQILRAGFGREIHVVAHRPKRVSAFAAVIELKEHKPE
jgi:hypothetical protein